MKKSIFKINSFGTASALDPNRIDSSGSQTNSILYKTFYNADQKNLGYTNFLFPDVLNSNTSTINEGKIPGQFSVDSPGIYQASFQVGHDDGKEITISLCIEIPNTETIKYSISRSSDAGNSTLTGSITFVTETTAVVYLRNEPVGTFVSLSQTDYLSIIKLA